LECARDYGSYKTISKLAYYVTPVKFIAEKLKCAGLGDEIGFLHQIRAARSGW
jgi:hypothetical protein